MNTTQSSYEYAVLDRNGTIRYRSYTFKDCLAWLVIFEDIVPGYTVARRWVRSDIWRTDWQD